MIGVSQHFLFQEAKLVDCPRKKMQEKKSAEVLIIML